MNADKRAWVRWIAWGIVRGLGFVWTIEERQPGLFFCVCYDRDFTEGVAVNEAADAGTAKRQAFDESGGAYPFNWVPVGLRCNRHHHHSGACDHLHWDKTDRVCGRPVGFSS